MVADQELLQFFGKRLRAARHAAHLSQSGLARRLQLGQDTISHYEGGQCRPDLTTLARLAEALSVSISYFFPESEFGAFGEAERETLTLLNRLAPTTAQALYGLIQQCAEAECRQQLLLHGADSPSETRWLWQRWFLNELRRIDRETPHGEQHEAFVRLNTLLLLLTRSPQPDLHPRAVQRLTHLLHDWLSMYGVQAQP